MASALGISSAMRASMSSIGPGRRVRDAALGEALLASEGAGPFGPKERPMSGYVTFRPTGTQYQPRVT
jgi:hypothetical protein